MKKHLALVLALVMVLTSFSFVSAAPDFSDIEGATYENAVKRLELLGILEGYPDGTFKPEDSITRAEFAAVAIRAKGLEGVAVAAAGLPSGFSDVPAGHWASGFVGTAASTGIVNGIGNGLFAPAAPVKYEEAVTMLVRALGYEPEAQTKGGYPFGYLVVAEEIGLLDDARGVQGTWATRGLVAQLTDNAMEIPMMVSIGFGDNVRWVVSGSAEHGGNEVYLLNSLGVDEYEGIVMENFRVNSRLDADEIKLFDLDAEKTVDLEITESVDVDAILGLEVTAWAMDDVVFAVTVDTDADLVAYDTVSAADEDDADLVVLDDTFDWAVRDENYGDATVYVNNEDVAVEDAEGFGRIVMNDDDEIVFAYLFDFDDFGVVTEIDDTDMEFVNIETRRMDTLELDEAEEVYVFTKEFAAASLEDVAEDMSVFYWVDGDDNYYIVAFEAMVEGNLDLVRVRDNRVNVEGTNYTKASMAAYSNDELDNINLWDSNAFTQIEELVDENVIVYLDVDGKAMLLTTDVSITTTVYGVVTWYSEGKTDEITVFNGEGEEVEYTFADRDPQFSGDKEDWRTTNNVYSVGLELDKDSEALQFTTGKSIEAATGSAIKNTDNERITIGTEVYYIDEDTVIIAATDKNSSDVTVLDPSVIKYEDLVDKTFATATEVQFIEGTGRDLALLVFVDPEFSATDDDAMFGIVTVDEERVGSDYYVTMDVAGEGEAEYTLSARKDLRKGDLVKFTLNNDGEVVTSDIDTLRSLTKTSGFVADVRGDYIFDGSTYYRVKTDSTLFYTVTETGAFDREIGFGRINDGDRVVVLADDNHNAKVVIDITPFVGASTVNDNSMTFTATGSSIEVKNIKFDSATTDAKNTYTVKVTGDASTTAVYSPSVTLLGTEEYQNAMFNVEIEKSGFYDVELIRVADEKVIGTDRVYLEK